MKLITSKDNKIFKIASSLLTKKYRDKLGCYIVEGKKFVNDTAKYTDLDVVIFNARYDGDVNVEAREKVFMMGELYMRLAQTENSQGVLALAKKKLVSRDDFITIARDEKANILVLDGIQDPGNVGTIIRTAEAAGVSGIIVIKGSCDIYSPKVVRAAASSVARMNFLFVDSQDEAIEILRRLNKRIVVSVLGADSCFEQDYLGSALVVGSEGSGVSKPFIANADLKVSVPMETGVESLNVAVATGILLYRQKGN